MTREQEKRGAELFAAGRSEREVADELGCSASTAHRLRERLQAAPDKAPASEDAPEADEAAADGDDAELAALREMRDALAEQLQTDQGRADSSFKAIQDLEAERRDVLAEGGDAVQLRQRLRDARADLDDWATASHLLGERLAAVDARIAEISGRGELARLSAELDAAATEWGAVRAQSGDRQRAAVAAVMTAAADFCQTFGDEDAAAARVTRLQGEVAALTGGLGKPAPMVAEPPSTSIGAGPDAYSGPGLALSRALIAARRGDVGTVAEELGKVGGWLPPGPPTAGELEERRRIAAGREEQMRQLREANQRGPGAPAEDNGPVDLDEFGRPVDKFGNVLVPRGSLPHPLDVYRQGYADSIGTAYQPGYTIGG